MAAPRMFKLCLLGAPGSGKGTIASRIARDFKLKHLASGDLLRAQVLSKTELGNSANQYMQAGKLVPDEVVVGLMLAELTKVRTTPWILDGFPRTREQAEVLHKEEKLDFVVSLEVPDDVIIDRIKGRWTHLPSGRIYHTEFKPPEVPGKDDITGDDLVQREDDKPESVRKRLEMYRAKTHPLKEFYDVLGILRVFHGTESNVIYPRVHTFLKDLIPASGGPF